jgi:hypothetical protein
MVLGTKEICNVLYIINLAVMHYTLYCIAIALVIEVLLVTIVNFEPFNRIGYCYTSERQIHAVHVGLH